MAVRDGCHTIRSEFHSRLNGLNRVLAIGRLSKEQRGWARLHSFTGTRAILGRALSPGVHKIQHIPE
jgi:hypothetical protein